MQSNESKMNHEAQLLGIPEAANFLSLSQKRLRQLVKDKEIGSCRIGRRLSISVGQLAAFVEKSSRN